MGDVAASGGYYIAMAADVIVAQPGTLTGSIGVIMGKPVFQEAFEKVGITTDSVSVGRGANMFAPAHPFSEDDWQRINAWLDAIYSDFTQKVASGRRMTAEQVHEIARGRVWTGADAAQNGLVDELGGVAAAAGVARRPGRPPARAPPGGAAGRRTAAHLSPGAPAGPVAATGVQRVQAGRRGRSRPRRLLRLGPRLAARGPRGLVTARTADPPRPLDNPLTKRATTPSRHRTHSSPVSRPGPGRRYAAGSRCALGYRSFVPGGTPSMVGAERVSCGLRGL